MTMRRKVSVSRKFHFQKGILFAADRAREEGKEVGYAEGRAEGLRESALKMLKAGVTADFIHEMTGLSFEEIKNLI